MIEKSKLILEISKYRKHNQKCEKFRKYVDNKYHKTIIKITKVMVFMIVKMWKIMLKKLNAPKVMSKM